jgi:hypothetical protein
MSIFLLYLGPSQSSQGPHLASFPAISHRSHEYAEIEYEGYDGFYNNRAHPEWGAVGMWIYTFHVHCWLFFSYKLY